MRSSLVFAVLLALAAGYNLPAMRPQVRARAALVMKGKGTRGMPGKGVRPPAKGLGKGNSVKDRMMKNDRDRSEWTLVASKEELGKEFGSTMAVEAGMSPQGSNYIWTLIRGDDGDGEGSTVWATDGSCRACT